MSLRTSAGLRILCALMTLACLSCDWASPEAKKAKHREHTISYFEKSQYQEARFEYQNVVQIDPNDADAHYRLGSTYLKLGGQSNLRQAFAALSQTVESDKTNRDAQLNRGELYVLSNEPGKAHEQADLVLVSAPQDAEGLILKGRSLINEQHYAEGIKELIKAIELDPQNMQPYIDLARAYFAAKDPAAAEKTLNQALTVNPRSTEIMLARGDFSATTGKPDQAEIIYKQTLEIAPENEAVYLRLAGFYQRYNKWPEVEATLQKLATVRPQDEKPQIYLGDFFAWLGQPDKALASYQRATEIDAGSINARDKLISHFLDSRKIEEAEARTKVILEKNPEDLSGRIFDARIRLARGKVDEAISLLQGVVKDEHKFALAHHFLGVAFMQKHQIVQARGAFMEAVKLNPNLSESRTALAGIHLADGSLDLAIEQAQAAIQLNPRNVQAAIIAGDAYLRKGDFAKSRQVFEAVAQGLPKEAIGPYRLGLVARAEKNDAKALAYFEDALSRKPSAIEPLAQIAMVKIAQGKSNEARERVTKQLEASPNNPLLYNLLGQLWMQAKDTGQAEIAFKKAIELDNSLLPTYMSLGQLYHQAGKTDHAEKEYEAVLAKDPKAIQAHMLLGIIHESQKEYEKAQRQYQESLKLNPRFAPAANNLAWILVEQGGNLDTALSYAQIAREQKPDDPHIADTLGWIYYKKNAYPLAVNLLKEAVEKLPKEPKIQYHYGMAQYKNGDAAGAKKTLQASLKLSQTFTGSEEARKTLARL